MTPLGRDAGITCVAAVTGHVASRLADHAGISVWQAVRPNSRGAAISVAAGLTDDDAKVAAVMGSIERHTAEHCTVDCRVESVAGLSSTGRLIDPMALPLDPHGGYHPHAPIPFVTATDLATDQQWWVPFELVHTNTVVPLVAGSGTFRRTTIGLAAGATIAEAVLHGVCEVIRDDAVAASVASGTVEQFDEHGDIGAGVGEFIQPLLTRLHSAGISAKVRDITTTVGVPCFHSRVTSSTAGSTAPSFNGVGCHRASDIAVTQSLLNAVRGCVTASAGLVDTGHLDHTAAFVATTANQRRRTTRTNPNPTIDHDDDHDDDLVWTLQQLRKAGLPQVLVVDLSRPETPLKVVRVLVPGAGFTAAPRYERMIR